MNAGSIVNLIWIAGTVLEVLLVGILLYGRMWRNFPFFTSYAVFTLTSSVISFATRGNGSLYFYSYWADEAIGIILGFAVVFEIFRSLFAGHAALRKLAVLVFGGALVILLITATYILVYEGQSIATNIGKAVMVMEEAVRTIEVGALVVLFLCTRAFGLHWRQSVFGIALGLGLFAAIELVAITLRSKLSPAMNDSLNIVRGVAYTASLIVWGTYMLLPERATDESQLPQRGQLEQWNQAILELIHQ